MGIHRKEIVTLTRTTGDSSGTETINTIGGLPFVVFLDAMDNANSNVHSSGSDDGANICVCNYTTEVSFLTTLLGALGVGSLTRRSTTESININNNSNGWTAKITALNTDGFTITWTKVGTGRNITVKCLAIL